LRLGDNVRFGVLVFYALALILWVCSFWLIRPQPLALLALAPAALHLIWQVTKLDSNNGAQSLAMFRSNRFTGLLVFLACLVLGEAG
jgi:4-hydroxybenzoate polyprenyltransferase